MSTKWDINHIRKIAGLAPVTESVLTESHDEDDDLSPAEKALAAKAESELKAKGVKVGKVDPEKDISRMAKKHKGAEEAKERAEEKEEKESAESEKKEKESEAHERKETEKAGMSSKQVQKQERKEAAKKEEAKREGGEEKPASAEAKRRGKAPSDSSGAGQLRSWVNSNPNGSRKEAWAHARDKIGMTPAGFSTNWQKIKGSRKAATEGFVLLHPTVPSFLLAENREMNQYQWVDMNSSLEPVVFFTEAEAQKLAKYLAEWKNQGSTLIRVDLTEAEDDAEEAKDPDALKKVSAARSWLKANPDKSREEFADHMAKTHGWSSHTAHTSYASLKK